MTPKRKHKRVRRGSGNFVREYIPKNGGVKVIRPKRKKK